AFKIQQIQLKAGVSDAGDAGEEIQNAGKAADTPAIRRYSWAKKTKETGKVRKAKETKAGMKKVKETKKTEETK
ncbi:MAG: hypothetical protein NC429_17525, partial [Lachnospiraceae bacterium]|nr:hypothetical protein [Lachnospiraceae bacterium]